MYEVIVFDSKMERLIEESYETAPKAYARYCAIISHQLKSNIGIDVLDVTLWEGDRLVRFCCLEDTAK